MQTNTFERWITTFYILIAFYVVGVAGVAGGIQRQKRENPGTIVQGGKSDVNQDLENLTSIFSKYRNTFAILVIIGIFSGFRNRETGNKALISIVLSIIGLMVLVAIFQYLILDIDKFFNGLIVTIGVILALVFGVARFDKAKRLEDYDINQYSAEFFQEGSYENEGSSIDPEFIREAEKAEIMLENREYSTEDQRDILQSKVDTLSGLRRDEAEAFTFDNSFSSDSMSQAERSKSRYTRSTNFFIWFLFFAVAVILYTLSLSFSKQLDSQVLVATNAVIVFSVFMLFMNGKSKSDAAIITIGSIIALGNLSN